MAKRKALSERIRELLVARYPIVYVITTEEERVMQALQDAVRSLSSREIRISVWSLTRGYVSGSERIAETDPIKVLQKIENSPESGVFVLKDLHHFIPGNPPLLRQLRDLYQILRDRSKFVFIMAPRLVLPDDLRKEVAVLEAGLPDIEELTAFLNDFLARVLKEKRQAINLTDAGRFKLVRALQGLTINEARHALNRVLFGKDVVDETALEAIFAEKAMLTRKEGVLEFVPENVTLDQVGGLDVLKDWLKKRKILFAEDQEKVAALMPKGILLMGMSGCGKSMSAKVIAGYWDLPLFRLDMNNLYSGVCGPPEEAFGLALRTAEAVAPAVLWIDEIEMGVAGYQGAEKSGTSSRIFAAFLTWMQEKEAAVFVAATANRIDLLPAEILRKGRFDQIFFCDLPSEKDREEIFRVHLTRRGNNMVGIDLSVLSKATKGWNGAEIEQCVVASMIDIYNEKRGLMAEDLYKQMARIIPLSHTMAEQIKSIKSWAHDRALSASLK